MQAPGALFSVGDGHAGQGDGEVDLKALETSLKGRFQFVVRKHVKLDWPMAETPTAYLSMGFHEDLNEAVRICVRNIIDFLVREKRLSADEAYRLTSVAVDLHIAELVDGNNGVYAILPKNLFVTGK